MQDGDQATPGSAAGHKREGFVHLDRSVLTPDFPRVGSIGIAVFLAISSHAGKDNTCWASYNTIAQEAQCSRRSAVRSVAGLVTAGVIRPVRRKGPRGQDAANGYEILRFRSATQSPPNPFKECHTVTPGSATQSPLTCSQGVPQWHSEVESLVQVESIEGEAPSGALPVQPPLSLITVETTPQPRSVANNAPARVMQQIEQIAGARIGNRARAGAAIQELLDRGWSEWDITHAYEHKARRRKDYQVWYLLQDIQDIIAQVRQGNLTWAEQIAIKMSQPDPDLDAILAMGK